MRNWLKNITINETVVTLKSIPLGSRKPLGATFFPYKKKEEEEEEENAQRVQCEFICRMTKLYCAKTA